MGDYFFLVEEVIPPPFVNPIYNVACIQLDIHRELLLHYTDIPPKGTLYLTPSLLCHSRQTAHMAHTFGTYGEVKTEAF